MSALRDRIIAEVRRRARPTCISCLSFALNADYNIVREASHDVEVLRVFRRSLDACPECRLPGIVLHPEPST